MTGAPRTREEIIAGLATATSLILALEGVWLDGNDPRAVNAARGLYDEIAARVLADAPDTKRLDWLESSKYPHVQKFDGGWMCCIDRICGPNYETARDAIDAAMKGAAE
ncbi:hypothetical protein [Acetobacter oeni]|uniref:Uncharacterized protein n=1 Tax=Acetobacter oeni TaxID=304077 RepID=A0A511XJR0_9PROT|nr:hypothetical protein [Acetobacter oeni]MBB3883406.1 hypothetical protein [Acetobacter oeni]NHO19379.1 hypothetical protein [Acetobacter oeni]GBR03952.1 hypothetical protein AA21952_1239 [Acetobacter oeni LMG 21952]GEN63187.1 hypothetical protein AOE01nite_14110 [Acetobacter oeni]